ncbi:hypothetical protein J6590_076225 [Homalodisca vitripennis]|nr:hypothetical protein J6590_076225 [Homalodisca vitripennis]
MSSGEKSARIAQFANLMGQSDLSYDQRLGRYRARNIIFIEKISGMSNVRAFCRLTMEDRAKSHWTFFVVHSIPDHECFVRSELAPTVRPLSGLQKMPVSQSVTYAAVYIIDSPSARWGLRPQAPIWVLAKFGDKRSSVIG